MESRQSTAGAAPPDRAGTHAESAPGALRPLPAFDPASLPPARVTLTQVSPRREGLHETPEFGALKAHVRDLVMAEYEAQQMLGSAAP